MEEGIPDIAAGMVGSVFSYLFSTSIWARFAVESRIPGVPARSLWVAIFLMVSDHPFLCASVAGVLFCLGSMAARGAFRRHTHRPTADEYNDEQGHVHRSPGE